MLSESASPLAYGQIAPGALALCDPVGLATVVALGRPGLDTPAVLRGCVDAALCARNARAGHGAPH